MKTNNQPKLKNKIFIIWGLFITGVILVLLIILLLAMNKPQPKVETPNQPTLINKIFIIWGLFITGVILFLLIILLLAMNKPQPKVETPNQPTLTSKTNLQQEEETYNAIMNSIQKEIGELTNIKEQNPSLKYPPKTIWNPDGTINQITELNQDTGDYLKTTYYNQDGTVKEIINY
uniref:DUF2963 domain-containing protein n=1 Tax=Primula red phytoplasma TaxID=1532528 RepID=A0A096XTM2_9MOLU|nr:DUF2963 domain-containing protein [Primula red phytoplasma]AIJ02302.1 hypothetical protein [Primula red phytoplasma]